MSAAARKTPATFNDEVDLYLVRDQLAAESTTVQTLILSKERFKSADAAKAWAKAHDFKTDVDETSDSYRMRQRDPGDFAEGSFRTIEMTTGVSAVIGKLKEGKSAKVIQLRGNEPQGDWRLLRATIKVVGPKVDPDTGNTVPAKYDPGKPVQIEGVANAAIVDRVNEMLDPRGAILTNYLKNPQILYNHDYCCPIGNATMVEAKDDGLHFAADIGRPDLAPLTESQDEARSLIAQGILTTVSVGFIPLEMTPAEYDDAGNLTKAAVYTRWELLEISVVSVPCNADSIFQMKELQMTKPRAAGALPMTAPAKTTPPPAGHSEPDGDEPVAGTAGEMLKAVLDHVGGLKEYAMKTHESIGAMHTKMDDLHKKVDGLKPDDKEVTQTPSGTEGEPEPIKAVNARIEKLEGGLNKLAEAVGKLAESVATKQHHAGRL